jgi:hypothetical protein
MRSVAPPLPASIAERPVFIIQSLCEAVAAHGPKNPSSVPLIVLICHRLRRLSARFTRLVAAVREGRLAAPRPRARGQTPPPPAESPVSEADPVSAPAAPPARKQRPRLPHGFGWMLRFGWQVAGGRSQFEHWLEDPEVAALLKEVPQAGRVLRPLCHMLGIRPGPLLSLPRRERPPRIARRADSEVAESASGPPPDARSSPPERPRRTGRPRRTRVWSLDLLGANPPFTLPARA